MTELDYGGIKDRETIAVLGAYFRHRKLEYSSGNLVYYGVNFVHKVSTASEDWEIIKYVYSDGNLTDIEGPLKGAWDDRASLDWA